MMNKTKSILLWHLDEKTGNGNELVYIHIRSSPHWPPHHSGPPLDWHSSGGLTGSPAWNWWRWPPLRHVDTNGWQLHAGSCQTKDTMTKWTNNSGTILMPFTGTQDKPRAKAMIYEEYLKHVVPIKIMSKMLSFQQIRRQFKGKRLKTANAASSNSIWKRKEKKRRLFIQSALTICIPLPRNHLMINICLHLNTWHWRKHQGGLLPATGIYHLTYSEWRILPALGQF